jgi:hypothetical protein
MILIFWRWRQKSPPKYGNFRPDRILRISFHGNFINHNVGWFSQWQQCLCLYNLTGFYFTFSMSREVVADYIITFKDVRQVSQYSRGKLLLPFVPWWQVMWRTLTNCCEGEISVSEPTTVVKIKVFRDTSLCRSVNSYTEEGGSKLLQHANNDLPIDTPPYPRISYRNECGESSEF